MKLEIDIRLTHTVHETTIPEKTFAGATKLVVDLPFNREEFLEAVEGLSMNSLPPTISRLCETVEKRALAYIADIKASGVAQLELALNDSK